MKKTCLVVLTGCVVVLGPKTAVADAYTVNDGFFGQGSFNPGSGALGFQTVLDNPWNVGLTSAGIGPFSGTPPSGTLPNGDPWIFEQIRLINLAISAPTEGGPDYEAISVSLYIQGASGRIVAGSLNYKQCFLDSSDLHISTTPSDVTLGFSGTGISTIGVAPTTLPPPAFDNTGYVGVQVDIPYFLQQTADLFPVPDTPTFLVGVLPLALCWWHWRLRDRLAA